MRNLITSIVAFWAVYSVQAQGTLQFNQVLILDKSTTYTVPAGKVWKIENALYTSYSINYNNSPTLTINGVEAHLIPFSFYDGNSYGRAPFSTAFPIWLPDNTTLKANNSVSVLTAIEFNIIP